MARSRRSARDAASSDLRQRGPIVARWPGHRPRREPDGVLQQLHALESAGLVDAASGAPRCRPAAPRVRRHRRRAGPLPDRLRRPRDAACSRRSGRSAATASSTRSSRSAGGRSAIGSGVGSPSGCRRRPADRSRARARRHPGRAGLPRRGDGRRRTGRSGCGSTTARSTTSPRSTSAACDAELELFRELLGADVDPRDAHRDGRSLLHLPDRRPGPTPTGSGLLALDRDARRRAGRRGGGTSETLATNDAAAPTRPTCSCSSTDRMPSRPSVVSSSRMYVLSISGPSVLMVKRTPLRRKVSKIQRSSSQPDDDARVEVRGRADLEDDPPLAEHRHRARVVGGLDAVADAGRLERLDRPRAPPRPGRPRRCGP